MDLPSNGVPAGIVVDGSGNVWIADEKNRAVVEYSPSSSSFSASIPLPDSGIPSGITWVHNDLWIGDSLNHVLWTYNPSSGTTPTLAAVVPLSGVPVGIAADGNGNIWVVDGRNNSLLEYVPSTGGWYGPLSPPGGFSAPRGVAVPPGTDVYVVDAANLWIWNGTTNSWTSVPR